MKPRHAGLALAALPFAIATALLAPASAQAASSPPAIASMSASPGADVDLTGALVWGAPGVVTVLAGPVATPTSIDSDGFTNGRVATELLEVPTLMATWRPFEGPAEGYRGPLSRVPVVTQNLTASGRGCQPGQLAAGGSALALGFGLLATRRSALGESGVGANSL